MRLKIIFLIPFFIAVSCTVQQPTDPIPQRNNLSSQYPFFDIQVNNFVVFNQSANGTNPSAQDQVNARTLTVSEKQRMLEALSVIRFAVNTPEFADLMRLQTYIAGANFSGPNGTVNQGQSYPDNNRLLQTIQERSASVTIRKQQTPINVLAVGQLPIDSNGRFYNAYVDNRDNPLSTGSFFVGFNNRARWDTADFAFNEAFLANILFHELLHNMGYTHAEPLDINRDTVYILGAVMEAIVNSPVWQNRYATDLAQFRSFYPNLNRNLLQSPTTPTSSFSTRSGFNPIINLNSLQQSYDRIQTYYAKNGMGFKCVYDEATQSYVMKVEEI